MHNMMSDEYEKSVFSEYHGRKEDKGVFSDPSNTQNVAKLEELQDKQSLEYFYEWIQIEGRDIEV